MERGQGTNDRRTSHWLVVSTHILNNPIDWTLKHKFRQHLLDVHSGMGALWKVKALIATSLWLVILVIHGIGTFAQPVNPNNSYMYSEHLDRFQHGKDIGKNANQACDCNDCQLGSSSQDIQSLAFISLDAKACCGKKCARKKAKKAKKKAKKTQRKKQNKRIQKLRGKSKEEN